MTLARRHVHHNDCVCCDSTKASGEYCVTGHVHHLVVPALTGCQCSLLSPSRLLCLRLELNCPTLVEWWCNVADVAPPFNWRCACFLLSCLFSLRQQITCRTMYETPVIPAMNHYHSTSEGLFDIFLETPTALMSTTELFMCLFLARIWPASINENILKLWNWQILVISVDWSCGSR